LAERQSVRTQKSFNMKKQQHEISKELGMVVHAYNTS
jgi:hypothetical protein